MINYINLAYDLHDLEAQRKAATGDTTSITNQIDSVGLDLYYKAFDLTYIGFVFCHLAMQNMFRSIYTGYIKQQMYFYTVENFLD
jgi:hypothetical protein